MLPNTTERQGRTGQRSQAVLILIIAFLLIPSAGRAQSGEDLRNVATEISASLAGQVPTGRPDRMIVAVLPFARLEGGATETGSRLAEELTTQLFLSQKVRVVERALLDKLVNDHQLVKDGILDPASVSELGRLSNASAIVTGTYADLGDRIRLNARLISTKTGEVLAAAAATLQTGSAAAMEQSARDALSQFARAMFGPRPELLKGYRYKAEVTEKVDGKSAVFSVTSWLRCPDQMRIAVEGVNGLTTYVVGSSGAVRIQGTRQKSVGSREVESLRSSLHHDLFMLARNHANPDLSVESTGHEETMNTPCNVLLVETEGASTRLWVAEDGRVLQMEYSEPHPRTGKEVLIRHVFSEFKRVGVLWYASTDNVEVDHTFVRTIRVLEFELDPQTEPGFFKLEKE